MLNAKKSLGQHWLRSERVAKLIVQTAEIKTGETVLEIGPGTGFLTKFLLQNKVHPSNGGARVIAIEKDDRAVLLLQKKFADEIKDKELNIIHGDVLELDLAKLNLSKYKLVANIPYYITGQIIRKFLSKAKVQPEKMVLLVQDEVAQRIVADDKKESILSISVKAYGEPKYVQKVPAKLFLPMPKVASAVLLIDKISKNNFRNISEEKFFEIVKKGFSSKRKMLRNHLKISPETSAKCKIAETNRAEDLNLANWLCLAKHA